MRIWSYRRSYIVLKPNLFPNTKGLGLAVVARIVEQLGGQLRVDSTLNKGSRFSFLLPLSTEGSSSGRLTLSTPESSRSSLVRSVRSVVPSRTASKNSRTAEIDNLVEALSSSHMPADGSPAVVTGPSTTSMPSSRNSPNRALDNGRVEVSGSANPLKAVKVDEFDLDPPVAASMPIRKAPRIRVSSLKKSPSNRGLADTYHLPKLRILIVEVGPSYIIEDQCCLTRFRTTISIA